jgi:hypothetical protein
MLEEYILAQHMKDEEIDDAWKIPEKYRFDIFNNIKSICLWETDSIDFNNDLICDIYKVLPNKDSLFQFNNESDFNKHELINSFLCSNDLQFNSHDNNWNTLIKDVLTKNNYESAYIIYLKINARGYATHDEMLHIDNCINIKNLKFHTKDFVVDKVKSSVIKKLIYKPNIEDEKVLHDFYMLDSARESLNYNYIGLQKVMITKSKILYNWIKV